MGHWAGTTELGAQMPAMPRSLHPVKAQDEEPMVVAGVACPWAGSLSPLLSCSWAVPSEPPRLYQAYGWPWAGRISPPGTGFLASY